MGKQVSRRSPRCKACGEVIDDARATSTDPLCARCVALTLDLFTWENGAHGAREVMLGQHANEPRRKALELAAHTVVVFFTEALGVAAMEIETKDGKRVLRWNANGRRTIFRVNNVGHGYANRDEMRPAEGFDFEALRRDIATSRKNLRPEILAALESAAR